MPKLSVIHGSSYSGTTRLPLCELASAIKETFRLDACDPRRVFGAKRQPPCLEPRHDASRWKRSPLFDKTFFDRQIGRGVKFASHIWKKENEPAVVKSIQIYSDLICPWCYIGKRRMEEALRQLPPGAQIVRSWHPFQLNPGMPPSGMDRKVYRSRKFGSWERSQAMDSDVAAAGETVGIKFRYDLQKHTPNTFDSHRVVWLAARAGVQEAVVESLFHAYFSEGANFSDRQDLIAAAVSAGLEAGEVKRLLESDEGSSVVRKEEEWGRALGISGVPFYIFNQQVAFSGAQPPATFLEAYCRASGHTDDFEKKSNTGLANDCGPSGCELPP